MHKLIPGARTAIVLAVALMAGCTLEPRYERPPAPVATQFPGITAQPAATLPLAADIGWRDFMHDARLQRLVELALVNNRDLRVALLNIDLAQAQVNAARAGLFPSVNGGVSGLREHGQAVLQSTGHATIDLYEVDATLAWQLDFFGRARSLEHAALDQYLASVEAQKAAHILLVASVANQYLTVLAYDEELATTQSTLATADESFRITKLRFDTGTGSELDLREAESALETARGQLASQTRARAQAVNALVLLVGEALPPEFDPGASGSLEDEGFLADVPAGLPSDLLERRPDVVEAERQLMAANANIGAARAAFFPSVSLTGLAGAISPYTQRLFRSATGLWDYGVASTIPIFDGGLNLANLKGAKAQREIAIAKYEKAIQSAFREVSDALVARSTLVDQTGSAERLVAAQKRRLELAQFRYKNGVDEYLTVLSAQNDLNTANINLVTTRLAQLTNLVTLYQVLGGGWIERPGLAPEASAAKS